mmetsp:Transcript_4699/g.7269  ORF Transcript_4699/g.7269 Transcript_4699/m.7269 type:complete len:476 (+) Transcript_4699:67-1494(+)
MKCHQGWLVFWKPSKKLLREVEKHTEKRGFRRIQKLINEKGADVNCYDGKTYWTPLGIACRNGNLELVQFLLENGARTNVAQHDNSKTRLPGTTALCVASELGHIEIVRTLLKKNADVRSTGSYMANGNTPLIRAIYGGNIEIALLLLENGAPIDCYSEVSPLYVASQKGILQIVQALLDKGANVDAGGDYEGSPVSIATQNGHTKVVEKLLEYGADLTKTDRMGRKPLRIAKKQGHTEIAEKLRKEDMRRESKNYCFLKGCRNQSIATQKLLEEVGKKDKPNFRSIKQLIAKEKADVNCTAANGWTPLNWACSEGHLDVAKLLLDNKAEVNKRGNGCDTPLFNACRNGHLKIVQLLLDRGASANQRNRRRLTPLSWACSEGETDLVKLLVAKGADVNWSARVNRGGTPLFRAIENGHIEIVKFLLKNGAKLTITIEGSHFNDMHEKLPDVTICALEEAIRNGQPEIAEVLRQSQ